jgi:hypothetical protein
LSLQQRSPLSHVSLPQLQPLLLSHLSPPLQPPQLTDWPQLLVTEEPQTLLHVVDIGSGVQHELFPVSHTCVPEQHAPLQSADAHPHTLLTHVSFVTEQLPHATERPSLFVMVPQLPPLWPMFVQVGGASHVFVFGSQSRPVPHVAGHVTDFPQLLVFVVLHAFPHAVAIASGVQHAFEPLQTSVDAAQHAPLQTTVDVQSHTFVVQV